MVAMHIHVSKKVSLVFLCSILPRIIQYYVNFLYIIDIHSFSQLWMTPWGYTKSYPKDYNELVYTIHFNFFLEFSKFIY